MEDLVASLTRQVKEEVIENYFRERRLIEVQIENLNRLAEQARSVALGAGERLVRLSHLMIAPEMREKLKEIMGLPKDNFWTPRLSEEFKNRLRLIRVHALTRRTKFRKLVVRSYSNLSDWTKEYRRLHEELRNEWAAVNSNIDAFHKNFDLLAILNLLRNMDVRSLEKKKVLGENFTANEITELDQNLYIRPVPMEKLLVPTPIEIPETHQAESRLNDLAEQIYRKYEREVKVILR